MKVINQIDLECVDLDDGNTMLAHLLINDVLFINSHWMRDDLPDKYKQTFYLGVVCSDTFYYACADCEDLPYDELERVYWMWRLDPVEGPSAWCIARRKQIPIRPVVEWIKKAGIWNLDELVTGKMPDIAWCRERESTISVERLKNV